MPVLEKFEGPWAGLPVAWTDADEFDESAYRTDVRRCCQAGVPGVYSGGTTGEFYAMELDEFCRVARATVEECRAHEVPAMIGCTSTYTRGAVKRAAFAAEIGAAAIQVALPFWMEIGEAQIVPFFREVSNAAPGLALSVYETTRAKRAMTFEQHAAVKEAVPAYQMVKANAGTIGCGQGGCAALSELVEVFVGESKWSELCPFGAAGGCSSMVYWNPRITLQLWAACRSGDQNTLSRLQPRVEHMFEWLVSTFGAKGFTDTAFDRLGGLATGFLNTSLRSRGPYPGVQPSDVTEVRKFLDQHFPEMLEF